MSAGRLIGVRALLRALAAPYPDTDCPACYRAELSPAQRLHLTLRDHLLPYYDPTPGIMGGISVTVGALIGRPELEPEWYARHYGRWVESGELAELHRMLRHVTMAG